MSALEGRELTVTFTARKRGHTRRGVFGECELLVVQEPAATSSCSLPNTVAF